MVAQIQMRRDTAANWTSNDPVLAQGEFGYETDTFKFKFGDGATAWSSLPYAVLDGSVLGHRYQFSTTTTDADPGSGKLRLNNASPASATEAYIDNNNYSGASITNYLDRFDDYGNTSDRGILRIQTVDDPDVYAEFIVTGTVTDGTGYRKISLTYVSHAGSFSNDEIIVVGFQFAGPAGADGAGAVDSVNGYAGAVVLDPDDLDDAATAHKFASAAQLAKLDSIESGATADQTAQEIATAIDADATAEDTLRNAIPASTTAKGTVELATAAEWRDGTDTSRALVVSETWDSAAEVTLTDAATIAVDMSSFINAAVTLGGNRTLGNPTNEKVGQQGYIRVVQDATGSRTLSFGTDYEFAGGTAPTLTTDANAEDLLFYVVLATDRVFISNVLDIS